MRATHLMICEVCQTENATVHLTQIINGRMQTFDLCEKCAEEKGVPDPAIHCHAVDRRIHPSL